MVGGGCVWIAFTYTYWTGAFEYAIMSGMCISLLTGDADNDYDIFNIEVCKIVCVRMCVKHNQP